MKSVSNPRQQAGFALVITLLLMALLVLLVVSMASLTRVETQIALNNQTAETARQHALMALNIALGQVQRHLGPDQRVTSLSRLKSATNPDWVGVWSVPAAGPVASNPDTWLVSGNELNNPLAVNPATNLNRNGADSLANIAATFDANGRITNAGQVRLAWTNSVIDTGNAPQGVAVPAVGIHGAVPGFNADRAIGRYAWWVSDESLKASANKISTSLRTPNVAYNEVNLADYTDATQKQRLDYFSNQYPNLSVVLGLGSGSFNPAFKPTWNANNSVFAAQIPRLIDYRQLSLLNGTGNPILNDNLRANFFRITPLAQGVLADTRRGGLREDWSARYGQGALEANTTAVGAYFNTRPATVNAANFVADYAPALPVPAVAVGAAVGFANLGSSVAPVITEVGIKFTFDESAGRIRLRHQFVVELWNPYAARINASILGAPVMKVSVRFPDVTGVQVSGTGAPQTFNISSFITSATVPTSTIWEAGEVKLFYSDGAILSTTTSSFTSVDMGPSGGLTAINQMSLPAVPLSIENLSAIPIIPGNPITASLTDGIGQLWQRFVLQGVTLRAASGATTPGAAIGFELNRNLEQWTNGGLAASSDPRWHDQANSTFYAPLGATPPPPPINPADGVWSLNPILNSNNTFTTGVFSSSPTRRFILFDLPRQEVTNLAQLRHVVNAKPYAIANAWGLTANDVFDKAFFSTLPRSAAITVDRTTPLPSPHHELYVPAGMPAPALTTLRDKRFAARYMLINGAFNINCPDERVWWTQIAHNRATYSFNNGVGGSTAATLSFPTFRTPQGAQQLTTMPSPNVNLAPTAGGLGNYNVPVDGQPYLRAAGRIMNGGAETQLLTETLASRIRAAGRPFASIEDFITTLTAGKSVLQTTIDTARYIPPSDPNPTDKNVNQGITDTQHRFTAGALTPADLIASIAPFITVRGDTFRIRAFGEYINPATLVVEGKAWCEATIQRTPDLLANPGALDLAVIAPTPSGSGNFGRRFVITSFRWLSPNDI